MSLAKSLHIHMPADTHHAVVAAEQTMQRIIEAITPAVGPDFFRSLAQHLTNVCHVDFACIVMVDQADQATGRAIAASHKGVLVDDISYDLRGTPCENVLGGDFKHHSRDVQRAFPTDQWLVDMGIDSYMGMPLHGSGGKPLGLIALLHTQPIDRPAQAETILKVVTSRVAAELERQMAEQALRDSEARHRAILESSLDGVVVFRVSGEILEFNAAAEAMFGRRREEVIGLNVADIIMPETLRNAHDRSLVHYVERETHGGIAERVEMPAMRADGTEFRVEVSLVPIDESRQLLSAAIRDITDRLKLEEQLRQSQKLHAIGQLAGGVAHDFNNLLTIVLGYTEAMLLDIGPSHPMFEAATQIHDAGERAALLTRQLLLFGRKAILEPHPVDVNAVIQHTGAMLRRLIGEDVTFATVLAPALPLTQIDRSQIEQVIVNLCLNARDAMPRGGRITIETRSRSFNEHYSRLHPPHKPGDFLELLVSDTGMGMTPDVVGHLFEPFFTTKGPGKGTGLGLATVYGILQQAGGFVTVETMPGIGSTFRVYLPSIERNEPQPPAPKRPAPSVGRETVLLVEDEDAVRRLARLSLERHGYNVLEAAGGEEAILLSETYRGPIDVLVTDVVMAGMHGGEVSERLRASRPTLKVLFMSGYNDDAVVRSGLVDPPTAFLQKPFDSRILATRIREVLGTSDARQ
jgi:two-component system cell cycle sensor histidine kinase/response regulator CckA